MSSAGESSVGCCRERRPARFLRVRIASLPVRLASAGSGTHEVRVLGNNSYVHCTVKVVVLPVADNQRWRMGQADPARPTSAALQNGRTPGCAVQCRTHRWLTRQTRVRHRLTGAPTTARRLSPLLTGILGFSSALWRGGGLIQSGRYPAAAKWALDGNCTISIQ